MNDFVVQGVTILGKTPAHNSPPTQAIFIIFSVMAVLFILFGCITYFKYHNKNDMLAFVFGALCFIIFAFISYKAMKVEDTYTISIDETASYVELNERFSDITKLDSGHYEVKLNVCD